MKRTAIIGWLALFTLLVGVFFYPTFTKGKLPVPTDALVGLYHPWRDLYAGEFPRGVPFKNFLITDPVRQEIPWRKLVIDSWKSGHSPAWNPYTFAGVPLNANIQAAPFYPLNVLFFMFDFPVAWTILIMLQSLLAGLFLFWYLRAQKLSPVASLVGAVAWAFGGFSISWMTWGTITQTALWAPLTLLSIDQLLHSTTGSTNKEKIRWAIVLTLSIVMTATAGHAQVAMYMLILAGSYLWWRMKSGEGSHMGLRWIGIAVGVAIVLTSVQWIPLLKFLPQTGRVGAVDSWKTAGWFLPWQHLVQFVAPDFFGNPATLNYWGVWNYGEFIGYIGVIPLVFAFSSLFLPGIPMFFSVMLVTALLFMLPNPVSILPFILRVPLLSVLQPTRLMVIVDLCLAVLAAYGVDAIAKHAGRMRWALAVIGFTIFALWGIVLVGKFIWHDPTFISNLLIAKRNLVLPTLLFAGSGAWYIFARFMKRGWRQWIAIGVLIFVIVFDLFRFGWKFTPFTTPNYFYPMTKALTYVTSQPAPFRVMSLDDRIMPPNTAAYYGIESIEGYDPIAPKRYENYLAASELGKAEFTRPTGFNRIYTAHNIDSKLLPYLNVRYVLALTDISRPFLRKVTEDGEVRIYEYLKANPRVYLADRIILAKNPEDIVTTLMTASPSLVGIVEQPIRVLSVPLSAEEGVQLTSYQPNEMHIRTTTLNPRLVVVLNSYNDGWTAVVDGISTPVMRVNYLFMGFVVPSGRHDVTLVYR